MLLFWHVIFKWEKTNLLFQKVAQVILLSILVYYLLP